MAMHSKITKFKCKYEINVNHCTWNIQGTTVLIGIMKRKLNTDIIAILGTCKKIDNIVFLNLTLSQVEAYAYVCICCEGRHAHECSRKF